jgi:hypothetical protein
VVDKWVWKIDRMILAEENQSTLKKPLKVPLFPQQIPYGQPWICCWASVVQTNGEHSLYRLSNISAFITPYIQVQSSLRVFMAYGQYVDWLNTRTRISFNSSNPECRIQFFSPSKTVRTFKETSMTSHTSYDVTHIFSEKHNLNTWQRVVKQGNKVTTI